MKSEIITIGDEILIGQTVDTNSAWIAQQLNAIGIYVGQITTVSDNVKHIQTALNDASSKANLLIITGGLGPTKDDVTKQALCQYFGTQLIFSQEVLTNIEQLLNKKGIKVNEYNKSQALVPQTAKIIQNTIGTAPILWFEKEGKTYIFLPGVPVEMQCVMTLQILPLLQKKYITQHILHKTILTYGQSEAFLAEKIKDWEKQLPSSLKLAYLPSPYRVKLRLTTTGENKTKLSATIHQEIEKLKKIIGKHIYGYDDEPVEQIVGKLLLRKKQTMATAESCTGGNIAHRITSIAGSSNYFKGSVISYANEVKQELLKVSSADIEHYGAVSQQVVMQMVRGVQQLLNTDYAIATSGIAGPMGGTSEKPVGTTWIAVANRQLVKAQKYTFNYNNREKNIAIATFASLIQMQKFILENA